MADFNIGKGVYILEPKTIEGGDPEAIASRFRMAGVKSAAVKICDGFRVLGDYEALIQTLRNQGIRVGAWGYSYLNRAPLHEAHMIADACQRYHPDFYLIDVEAEVEKNYAGARLFMDALRPAVPGLPLGLNSFWNVRNHPDFPWADFLQTVDFVCPQVYWRGVDPVGKLMQSQQGYADVPNAPEVPMPMVAGDLHLYMGVKATPEQVTEFLTAATGDPFIQGVLMWAADDMQTAPDLWQAFSAFQWKKGGGPIPEQPLGWAKIKAPSGVTVRSAPLAVPVGLLGRAELAPVWALTETKWAAITHNCEQWIFTGNPNKVDLTLDTSRVPGPPRGLYAARAVPARGLNVRDDIGGTILRALTVDSIVQVYEEKNGWARIHATRSEWVDAAYLSKSG